MELLVVIGIIAVLSAAVVIILNPMELLAEARDSQRMFDLDSVNRSLSYYLATASSTSLGVSIMGPVSCNTQCFVYSGGGTNCLGRHAGKTTSVKASQAVDGTGWIPVVLTDTTGGSPLAYEPIDPVNTGSYIYSYACDDTSKVYQVDAVLESTKFYPRMATDGGSSSTVYEIGTAPGLNL